MRYLQLSIFIKVLIPNKQKRENQENFINVTTTYKNVTTTYKNVFQCDKV